jgi:hypothetical protein
MTYGAERVQIVRRQIKNIEKFLKDSGKMSINNWERIAETAEVMHHVALTAAREGTKRADDARNAKGRAMARAFHGKGSSR